MRTFGRSHHVTRKPRIATAAEEATSCCDLASSIRVKVHAGNESPAAASKMSCAERGTASLVFFGGIVMRF